MKGTHFLYLLGSLLLLTSCWKEDLKNCWMGDVTFSIVAEKFQQPATEQGQLEENLLRRISSVRYYLYKDKELLQSGVINDATDLGASFYPLSFHKLAYGNYSLALAANTEEEELNNGDTPKELNINYPGIQQTKDYFTACYDFTVDCECGLNDFIILRRIQGVTHFKLEKLPPNIHEIEVEVNQIAASCQVDTTYRGVMMADYHFKVADVTDTDGNVSLAIGTFPTVQGTTTSVTLKFYADVETRFLGYQNTINGIQISRNQLTRISADFNYTISGNTLFTVTINPEWDGIITDGGVVIP